MSVVYNNIIYVRIADLYTYETVVIDRVIIILAAFASISIKEISLSGPIKN